MARDYQTDPSSGSRHPGGHAPELLSAPLHEERLVAIEPG